VIRSRFLTFLLVGLLVEITPLTPASASAEPTAIDRLINGVPSHIDGVDFNPKELKDFYAPRAYRPLWVGEQVAWAQSALHQIPGENGLNPGNYRFDETIDDSAREVALSATLIRLGRDLATGRVAPYRLTGGIGEGTRPHFSGTSLLKSVAQGSKPSDLLNALLPQTQDYRNLITALKTYRSIESSGGWPTIPDGPSIKSGDSDDRLPLLRQRLICSGDMPPAAESAPTSEAAPTDEAAPTGDTAPEGGRLPDTFLLNEGDSLALRHFQSRHGLDTDGAIGKKTLAALNVPVTARIHQIELSLERLRQLPRQREARHIDVNIASQTLQLSENKTTTLEMRVVTGDVKHQTPTMVTRVASITLNPTWTVPSSIARKEILPKLKKDPHYLAHNSIRLLDSQYQSLADDGGSDIDWSNLGPNFPYVLRQVPGPDNALGLIKFNLQNQDAIYMHDTPQKAFFKRPYRLLSHGCIRLEHPLDLAEHLLGTEWHDKLLAMIAEGKTKTLIVRHAVPVYLLYQTAWADAGGMVAFRDDSYGNDLRLHQTLEADRTLSPKG
jgi:L,D-transpeptidase YcbB